MKAWKKGAAIGAIISATFSIYSSGATIKSLIYYPQFIYLILPSIGFLAGGLLGAGLGLSLDYYKEHRGKKDTKVSFLNYSVFILNTFKEASTNLEFYTSKKKLSVALAYFVILLTITSLIPTLLWPIFLSPIITVTGKALDKGTVPNDMIGYFFDKPSEDVTEDDISYFSSMFEGRSFDVPSFLYPMIPYIFLAEFVEEAINSIIIILIISLIGYIFLRKKSNFQSLTTIGIYSITPSIILSTVYGPIVITLFVFTPDILFANFNYITHLGTIVIIIGYLWTLIIFGLVLKKIYI